MSGIEQVQLAVAPPLILAAALQIVATAFAPIRARVALPHFFGDLLQADAADLRRGRREVLVDERAIEADRFEDLRAAIALQRRDAHLRHHLQHALVERLDVALDRVVVRDVRQQSLADQIVERFEGEVRIHRARAVAEQQRDVMHFARFAGFDQQAALVARAFANEVMMHAGDRQQARNRRVMRIDAAIRQDQHADAGFDGDAGLAAQLLHRALEARAVFLRVVQQRQASSIGTASPAAGGEAWRPGRCGAPGNRP